MSAAYVVLGYNFLCIYVKFVSTNSGILFYIKDVEYTPAALENTRKLPLRFLNLIKINNL